MFLKIKTPVLRNIEKKGNQLNTWLLCFQNNLFKTNYLRYLRIFLKRITQMF